jgi:hypothetical protein
LIAAFICGTDAEMFGSLMMFASGRRQSWPSSARWSPIRCSGFSESGNAATMRPESEMSRVSTAMPAGFANMRISGSSE